MFVGVCTCTVGRVSAVVIKGNPCEPECVVVMGFGAVIGFGLAKKQGHEPA